MDTSGEIYMNVNELVDLGDIRHGEQAVCESIMR